MMLDIAQIAGAVLALVAFGLQQIGKLRPLSYPYLALNLLAGAFLLSTAIISRQWGFVLLNGVWGTIAAINVARRLVGTVEA